MAKYQAPARRLKAIRYNVCHALRNFPRSQLPPEFLVVAADARDWSRTSSIARRLLWWRRSLHRSPDDRVRGGDPFIDRRTIVFAEAIPSSIAGRSCSRRRSLHRSPDDRSRGGDPFFTRVSGSGVIAGPRREK